MFNPTNVQSIQNCLDDYMQRNGKDEINEIEANLELDRAGVLADDEVHPGTPLREELCRLRDNDELPQNVRQNCGSWKIKHSKSVQKKMEINQF